MPSVPSGAWVELEATSCVGMASWAAGGAGSSSLLSCPVLNETGAKLLGFPASGAFSSARTSRACGRPCFDDPHSILEASALAAISSLQHLGSSQNRGNPQWWHVSLSFPKPPQKGFPQKDPPASCPASRTARPPPRSFSTTWKLRGPESAHTSGKSSARARCIGASYPKLLELPEPTGQEPGGFCYVHIAVVQLVRSATLDKSIPEGCTGQAICLPFS